MRIATCTHMSPVVVGRVGGGSDRGRAAAALGGRRKGQAAAEGRRHLPSSSAHAVTA
jgi:hypothetical protein